MDFKINKIEPEIRQRINNMTREGIVHGKTGLKISSYSERFLKEKKKGFRERDKGYRFSAILKKQKITIDGEKKHRLEIDAIKEEFEDPLSYKGNFIDTKK